jgi:DNA-binding CsgD family transcriptional regulator
LGFALGFGWLWFPALQARWLPEALWGTPLDGGGGLFLAVLFIGFASALFVPDASAASAARIRVHPPASVRTHRDAAHGASLVCLAAAILPPWPGTGLAPYPPVLFLAVAGLCQGLYWGGVLLALPPRESGAAFLLAALAQAGLSLVYQFVAGHWRHALMILSLAAAWMAARRFARFARDRVEEARRLRGRPSKKQSAASAAAMRGVFLPRAALGAAFAALLAAEAAVPPSAPLAGLAFLTACGAAAGFLLCRAIPPQRLPAAALALAGLALILFPGAGWSWMAVPFAEGLFCLAAVTLLADPVHPGLPARRAARCLGIVLVLSFAAAALPAAFAAPQAPEAAALPIGVLALLLAAIMLLPFCNCRDARASAPEAVRTPGREDGGANGGSGLTRRELDVLHCLEKGMNDAQIAGRLGIRDATVRYHLANMFRKTGYRTRAKLAAFRRAGATPL